MPEARIIDVCDLAMAALIAAPGWAGYDPAPIVERRYLFRAPDEDARISAIEGRRVYVMPAEYSQAATLTRESDLNDYKIYVMVVELYRGDEAEVPNDWLDERVKFVQEAIYDVLGDARAPYLDGTLWPEEAKVSVVYNQDDLFKHRLFRSFCEFTFREVSES